MGLVSVMGVIGLTEWGLLAALWLLAAAARVSVDRLVSEVQDFTGLRRGILAEPEAATARLCAERAEARTRDRAELGPAPLRDQQGDGGAPQGGWVRCRQSVLWHHAAGPPTDVCAAPPGTRSDAGHLRRYDLVMVCELRAGGRAWRLPEVGTSLVR